jgi:hypothetical protein
LLGDTSHVPQGSGFRIWGHNSTGLDTRGRLLNLRTWAGASVGAIYIAVMLDGQGLSTPMMTGDVDGARRPSESATMLAGLWLMATAGTSYRHGTEAGSLTHMHTHP